MELGPFASLALTVVVGALEALASTRCIQAITDDRLWAASGWDLVISAISLGVIYTDDAMLYAGYAIGSSIGTMMAVAATLRKKRRERERSQ